MARYKLVLFDADETLFDFCRAERFALSSSLEQCGVSCSREMLDTYKAINKSLWLLLEQGLINKDYLQSQRFERLFEHFGIRLEIRDFNSRYLANMADCSVLIDGATDLCNELAERYTLAVVTNGVSAVQKKRIEGSVIFRYLDNVFVSEDTGFQKPMPGFFNYVFGFYGGIDRSEALIVGDSLTADIKGGNNAGLATCWYNPAGGLAGGNYRIDHEIRRLDELKDILI